MVTGASGEIGRAIADGFLRCGARVVAVDLDRPDRRNDERLLHAAADLRDHDAAEAVVGEALARFGRIDILVNNAAAPPLRGPVETLSPQAWDENFAVDLAAAFRMARAAIPAMRRGGRGVIVNLASQLGHVTVPGAAAYSTAKAGLLGLTRSLALDHAGESIRAVSVSPGAVLTGRLEKLYGSRGAAEEALKGLHPLGRLGAPAEVADAVLFLASDHAAFITGADLLVDGGYVLR